MIIEELNEQEIDQVAGGFGNDESDTGIRG